MEDAKTEDSQIDCMIAQEVCKMIAYDNHANPAKGVKTIKRIDFEY